MNKKLLSIILVFFACFIFFTIENTVQAAEPEYTTISGGIECFFAKGTEITIETKADGSDGATIKWNGGSQDVTNNVRVFGGGHADGVTYENSNVTMTGGTIRSIFGGGLHGSTVSNTNVKVTGGRITSGITGGGASVLANSTCHPMTGTNVTTANVTVGGNSNVETVFGGGEGGSSNTINANVKVTGGTINYLTAGGSNGNTDDAQIEVVGGRVNVMQSANRGTMNSALMEVMGGTVSRLYMGGEEGDANVTGTINEIALDIGGDATVQNLYIGTSGGTKIGAAGNENVVVALALHDGANVNIANQADFENVETIIYVYVTVDDIKYEIEKGDTLSYLSETLEKYKKVEGKEFVKFVKKGTDEEVKEDTVINEDIELEPIYKTKAPTDNTPPTGVDYKNIIIIVGMVALFVILNIGFYKKNIH